MDTKTILSDFANSPFFDFTEYDIEFDKVANDFLIFLLFTNLLDNKDIYIGVFEEFLKNKIYKEGACIVYDEYFPNDKELTLRYSDKSGFELLLSYYSGFKEKRMSHTYNLSKEEIERLPEGLVELMKSVKEKMQGFKVSSNTLNPR
jgi:hypothetical protein